MAFRKSYTQDPLVERIKTEIDMELEKGSVVYAQDIHAVGLGYHIGKHMLEEVIGGWYTWDTYTKLTPTQHKMLKEYIRPFWIEHGKKWKERGVY